MSDVSAILQAIQALERISPDEYAQIRSALDALRERSAEAERSEEVRTVGFPWTNLSSGMRETRIGLLGEYRVECEPVPGTSGSRWIFRVFMPDGSLMLENRGPGGEGHGWEAMQMLLAHLNAALQT